ncbi:DUF3516 domain-containing protein, partial [Salmonella enterica]|uniref:DUF3516 domain-containing protein n=1 Tax=Salmonella enterica TaxID=28901 RepID=UPI001B2FF53B|nr:DUF3516 domain-containing protein [Salmonella enterica subsp. enterica serovar Typhimurium]
LVVDTTPAADAPDGVLRYFEHELPLAPGTAALADDLPALLAAQNYELRFWQDQNTDLTYRRFFAVSELAGIRVERPDVFAESHREILRWLRTGLADGLRVDHPDGLVDPGAYLEQLADATGRAYTLVEKILEPGEALPAWWRTDGTTGYDALAELDPSFGAAAWSDALDAYFAEHDDIGTGPDARSSRMLLLTEGPTAWTARQIIDDPAGDHDWGISATVDLAASDEAGEAVVTVTAVDR